MIRDYGNVCVQRDSVRARYRGHLLSQILDDAVVSLQFMRLAKEIGISDTNRLFDPSKVPDCERAAIDWIVKGIDPDE
jgi:hypothetical protein